MFCVEYDRALAKLQEDMRLRNFTENTMKTYEQAVRAFLDTMCCPIEDISTLTIRTYLRTLVDRGLSPETYNVHNAAISFFMDVTLERGINKKQIPRMKLDKKLPQILTISEVQALFDVCDDIKYKAIFSLAYGSGLRISEIVDLHIRDIITTDNQRRIYIEKAKNRTARYACLAESTLILLRKYLRETNISRNKDAFLFPGRNPNDHICQAAVNKQLKKYLNLAGIKKDNVTMHSLRHSFGTQLYEDGVDLAQLKVLMGHKSLSSTLLYVHLADTETKVQSPMDSLSNISD